MIRVATTNDLAALAQLNLQIQRLHRNAEGKSFREPSQEDVAAWIADRLSDEKWRALVAEVEQRCAGYVLFERVTRPAGTFTTTMQFVYVHQLGVDTDFRRRGVGRDLLGAVENEAVAWGAQQVALDTWSFNEAAQAFFASCGYEVYNVRLRRQVNEAERRVG